MTTQAAKPTVLWIVTDDKPGHRSQQEGLAERLQALAPFDVHWLYAHDLHVGLLDTLRRRPVVLGLPAPQWILGAGAGTHSLILKLRHIYRAKAILLMKGAFPAAWFDANITPVHDNPPRRRNVLPTVGVMNPVIPRHEGRDSSTGTFLIGGTNEHFAWEDARVIDQVDRICRAQSAVHWTLTDSRRTPAAFLPALRARNIPNLTLISHQDTPRGFIKQQLDKTGQLWVTRDSVSMVYECLTSGAPTGLLDLTPLRSSRVVKDMQYLLGEGWVRDFSHWDLYQRLPVCETRLWEADRGARWLLEFLPR